MSRPENTVPLDALVELRLEKVASCKDPELPYVGLEHLAAGRPKLLGTLPSSASVSINGVFARDDILFGKLRPNLRKSLRAPFPGYCSTDILVLRARDGIRPDFAGHLFQWEPIFASAAASAAGTKMPRTSWGELKRYPVRQPNSESEQAHIAAMLDTADETIAKTEAVIAKLRQVRTGLIHDLLTCGLDENGHLRDPVARPEQFHETKLGRMPRDWAILQIQEVVSQPSDTVIGPFGSNLVSTDYRESGHPVVFVRDVREDGFVWNSHVYVSREKAIELRSHEVHFGDVVVTKMGLPPCIASEYPAFLSPGIITADVIRVRPKREIIAPAWLVFFINSERFRAQIRQITGGVTRPKVTLRDFRERLIGVPKSEEQAAIRNMVQKITTSVEAAEGELTKLQSIKSGLMDDLLTGRVRVPAPPP